MKYRIKPNKQRNKGKPFLLLLTPEEHEYLERRTHDSGTMADLVRGKVFMRGWRRDLDELRKEQA